MKRKYKCPACGEELKGWKCPSDNCHVDDIRHLYPTTIDKEGIVAQMVSSGRFYYDWVEKCILYRGGNLKTEPLRVPTDNPKRETLKNFAHHIRATCKMAYAQFTDESARELVAWIHRQGLELLPQVVRLGDLPHMFLVEDRPVFPEIVTDSSRLFTPTYTFYTGPALKPQDHGSIVDEWLASFRCATKEDREILRAWCYGAILQYNIKPGQFPALMISAANFGAGKTSTAEMLSAIFGQNAVLYWKERQDMESLKRKILEGYRMVTIDNLVPGKNKTSIGSSELAYMITQPTISVKRLYSTMGEAFRKNYYLYILTANNPVVSPELLSRMLVITLDRDVAYEKHWEQHWKKERSRILEHIMWDIQRNWVKGSTPPQDTSFRFPEWLSTVTRALGRPPTLQAPNPAVHSSYEVFLEYEIGDETVELSVSECISMIRLSRASYLREIKQQAHLSIKEFVEDVNRWSSKYEIFEKENQPWVRRKSE